MKLIGMIPARMGSQRLKQKNLRELNGLPLISLAIRKSLAARVFDEIWVNSEHAAFGEIAKQEGVAFHQRPPELASDTATSEDFVYEFLTKHPCDYMVQVHSIAPLLTTAQVADFTHTLTNSSMDVLLSGVNEQIECMYQDEPINFSFDTKTNSQELHPIQRITWSITGWKSKTYIHAYEAGRCATYAGNVAFYSLDRMAGHIIKTEEDFQLAELFMKARDGKVTQ